MTTPDLQATCLAKVDAEIVKMADFFDSADDIYTAQSVIDEENTHLRFIKALRVAIEMCSRNGYTTWDKSMVPLIDGAYEEEAAKKWESAHGHDIRLKCYPEFGCQLSIDPEDLLLAIAKELGVGE